MSFSEQDMYRMIIDIMDMHNEPDNLNALNQWIQQIGIEAVLTKIIQIYSLNII